MLPLGLSTLWYTPTMNNFSVSLIYLRFLDFLPGLLLLLRLLLRLWLSLFFFDLQKSNQSIRYEIETITVFCFFFAQWRRCSRIPLLLWNRGSLNFFFNFLNSLRLQLQKPPQCAQCSLPLYHDQFRTHLFKTRENFVTSKSRNVESIVVLYRTTLHWNTLKILPGSKH